MNKTTLILSLLTILVSCTNTEQEARIKKLEEKVLELDSTNTILKSENNAFKSEKEEKEDNEKKRVTESLSFDKRFVGSWKFHSMIPAAKDNSMEGIICKLEKYSNTQKTYVFHLFTGRELILSKKDENTLIGENANMFVKLNPKTGLLTLGIPGGSNWIFKKLK